MAQPHKGDRRQIKCRVDVDLYDVAQRDARRLGVPMSEYLAHALAVLMNSPEHDPIRHLLDSEGEQMRMTA